MSSSPHLDAGHRGEVEAGLAERLSCDLPSVVVDASAARRLDLLARSAPRAHALELGDQLVVDRVVDDAGLLGRADHRRVEGLGDQDVDDRHRDVGAAVDVDRRVAGADADARLAGLVGGGDRLRPAGRPDEVDARVVEEVLRDVERRVGDHLERVGRQPGRLAGRLEDLDRPVAQRAARAEGRKIIALRVLAATIALNSAVEVGLVIGSSASTTPIGSATYWMRRSGSSSITPTERLSLR